MSKRTEIKEMTKKQFEAVVNDYAGAFPDWLSFRGEAFYRDAFPIRQMIGFESFQSFGSPPYRVTCGIQSLVMPVAQQLYRAIRYEPTLAQHEVKWREIVVAMEREFQPDIRKPLDIAEITALCEAEEWSDPENPNKTIMLATLHAFLGNREEARRLCIRAQAYHPTYMQPLPQWVLDFKTFGLGLLKQIEAGAEIEFMHRSAREVAGGPLLSPDAPVDR